MDKPLYIFEPLKQATDWVLVGTVCLIVVMVLIALFTKKQTNLDTNRRNIVFMICFFIGSIAFGTAAFRVMSLWKLKPVQIFNNRVETRNSPDLNPAEHIGSIIKD